MYLVGRYEKVRGIGPAGPTESFVLDRKQSRLLPGDRHEWAKFAGVWIPLATIEQNPNLSRRQILKAATLAGGAFLPSFAHGALGIGGMTSPAHSLGRPHDGTTLGTMALSSAYVYNTSGNALCNRYLCPVNQTVTELNFWISGYTGTAANVNDLDWEIRDSGGTNNVGKPGANIQAGGSGTKDPASATGWITISSISCALTASTYYWFCIADADGNGTDHATVSRGPLVFAETQDYFPYYSADSSTGFSTTTLRSSPGGFIPLMNDGTVVGSPYTTVSTSTNGTNRRGLFVSNGFNATMKLWGAISTATSAGLSGLEVWLGATGPSGSANYSTSAGLYSSTTLTGFQFGTVASLTANTAARVVFTYGSGTTAPNKLSCGASATSTVLKAMAGKGEWYWAEADGTTDWSNDDTKSFPAMYLLVDDFSIAGLNPGNFFRRRIG